MVISNCGPRLHWDSERATIKYWDQLQKLSTTYNHNRWTEERMNQELEQYLRML